ncbi:MAG: hypothetical protein CMH98_03410 [Oceanospirillaceae bacterium]|nr:hypothetical protein [Oceanospirillaceae bacterium]
MEIIMSIGERLKEVREGLGMTQTEFAEIAAALGVPGATRQSQAKYEKGKSIPSAAYMSAIAGAGADVMYILTGKENAPAPSLDGLAPDEQMLLDSYRAMPLAQRKAMLASLLTADMPKPKAKKPMTKTNSGSLSIKGKNSNVQIVGRDYNEG